MPSNKVRYHSVETDKDGSMDGEPDDVMHRYTSPNAVVVEKPALWMLAASLAAFMLFLVGIAIGVVGSTSLARYDNTASTRQHSLTCCTARNGQPDLSLLHLQCQRCYRLLKQFSTRCGLFLRLIYGRNTVSIRPSSTCIPSRWERKSASSM